MNKSVGQTASGGDAKRGSLHHIAIKLNEGRMSYVCARHV